MIIKYILLVVIWIAWCTLHSILNSSAVTVSLRKQYPTGFRFYRLIYNLIALATLAPVIGYTFSIRGTPVVAWQGAWRIVPLVLGSMALFLFVAGARRYDFLQFLGLRQIKGDPVCGVLTSDCSLDTGGVLAMVRHPWYSAGILIVWARPLDPVAILTNLVISGYFIVGAILEEGKLKVRFGSQYADYQRRVSMFLPIKWVGRRVRKK